VAAVQRVDTLTIMAYLAQLILEAAVVVQTAQLLVLVALALLSYATLAHSVDQAVL
jgi:hypothetical protein